MYTVLPKIVTLSQVIAKNTALMLFIAKSREESYLHMMETYTVLRCFIAFDNEVSQLAVCSTVHYVCNLIIDTWLNIYSVVTY